MKTLTDARPSLTLAHAALLALLLSFAAVLITPVTADAVLPGQVSVANGRFQQDGAPITLKGVNVEVQEYFRPIDFRNMKREGFNLVRLRVHWATLQPNAPVKNANGTWTRSYDAEMLQRIKDYIGWAHAQGMSTIVDNHDCKWCTDFWYPTWTAQPAYNSANKTHGSGSTALKAYQAALYTDTLLKSHQGAYLEWLATQLRTTPGIVGYEVLNEPPPGNLEPSAATSRLMAQTQLSWARDIRRGDPDRVIFFQTRYGYLPGLATSDLADWAALGNVAADIHNGFGARWGDGIQSEPGRDDTGEVLQKVNNNITSAGVGPYSGTSVAQRNHLLRRLDTLAPYGIPLIVGEWGEGPTAGMANHGSIIAGMCSVGDARISWAHRDWSGPRGMYDNAGNRNPWADMVSAAAKSTCPGS